MSKTLKTKHHREHCQPSVRLHPPTPHLPPKGRPSSPLVWYGRAPARSRPHSAGPPSARCGFECWSRWSACAIRPSTSQRSAARTDSTDVVYQRAALRFACTGFSLLCSGFLLLPDHATHLVEPLISHQLIAVCKEPASHLPVRLLAQRAQLRAVNLGRKDQRRWDRA